MLSRISECLLNKMLTVPGRSSSHLCKFSAPAGSSLPCSESLLGNKLSYKLSFVPSQYFLYLIVPKFRFYITFLTKGSLLVVFNNLIHNELSTLFAMFLTFRNRAKNFRLAFEKRLTSTYALDTSSSFAAPVAEEE